MLYVYPAVLKPEDGGYSVSFPDVPGAITCADDLVSALENAREVLSMMAVQMEDTGEKFSKPTEMNEVQRDENDIVTLVLADTMAYRKQTGKRAVKKTLSIPQWLNEEAEKRGINFSQVLQEALVQKLDGMN